MRTVSVDLEPHQSRDAAANNRTQCMGSVFVPDACEPRDLFLAHYASFAATLRAIDEPGLAIVAIDEKRRRPAGILRIAARPGRVTGGVVGRHGCADLYLDGFDALSLRELAILVDPLASWQRGSNDVSYRIVDLRTGHGFTDEHGRRLAGVSCAGSAFFRSGPYTLMVLAVGDPSDWSEDAETAWAMIPERVFFDEQLTRGAPSPPRPAPRPPPPAQYLERRRTEITAIHAARPLHQLAAGSWPSGEAAVARLELSDSTGVATTFPITEAALHDGILVGRYTRCLGHDVVDDEMVSRTHLLVIRLKGRVWALDTGSTNGTWLGSERVRLVELETGTTLRLGDATRLVWR